MKKGISLKGGKKGMENSFEKAFFQLVEFLEKIEREFGIKYYLVGGILASLYSETRTTVDIDFVADINSVNYNIDTYIQLLKENDFYPFQDWENTAILAKSTNLLQYLDKQERVKFDNYILIRKSENKYKKIGPLALKRRVRINFLGNECWATSKEDYMLSKLIFGGWQDFSDALGCWMRFSETLDSTYLLETSKVLGVQKEYNLLISGIEDPDDYFEKLDKI